ncbi:hypothetical protein GCM10020000_51860 [Streptomyces olivoverticillatus]
MQGLDGQPHPVPVGVRAQFAERVGHPLPCPVQIPAPRRQPAADQDEDARPEFGRLLDGGPVVGERRGPARGVVGGQEAAPAQAADPPARRRVRAGRPP